MIEIICLSKSQVTKKSNQLNNIWVWQYDVTGNVSYQYKNAMQRKLMSKNLSRWITLIGHIEGQFLK